MKDTTKEKEGVLEPAGVKRLIFIEDELLTAIQVENRKSNTARLKGARLNSTHEILLLIADGIKWREAQRK